MNSQNQTSSQVFCTGCGAHVVTTAKYCGACGIQLGAVSLSGSLSRLSTTQMSKIVVLSAVIFGAAYGIQTYVHALNGIKKPTEVYQPPTDPKALPAGHPSTGAGPAPVTERGNIPAQVDKAKVDSVEDTELTNLRNDAEANPQKIEALKQLASALFLRVREGSPSTDSAQKATLALEAVDLLSRILQGNAEDQDALLMMADLSFDQRAFSKAAEFYERYLKLSSTDSSARARYASTLTFLGKFDDAIRELDNVLKSDPKNFPAMAYLAITYAQKGDVGKAEELGEKALAIAPSEEARTRFSGFLASLKKDGAKLPIAPVGGVEQVVESVKQNQIAGRKFVRSELTPSGELKLFFADFPMQGMPPFAKEKFFGGILAKVKSANVTELRSIVFLDSSSGLEMERIGVP